MWVFESLNLDLYRKSYGHLTKACPDPDGLGQCVKSAFLIQFWFDYGETLDMKFVIDKISFPS